MERKRAKSRQLGDDLERERKVVSFSATYGDRVSADEQARRVADEEGRRREIVNHFRLGVKRICAAHMWLRIENKLGIPSSTQSGGEIGDVLTYFEPQQLTPYRNGDASLERIVAFMTDAEMACGDFDPLPLVRERALGGYQLAIARMEDPKRKWPKESEKIDEKSWVLVLFLLDDPVYWSRRGEKNDLDLSDWQAIHESCERRRRNLSETAGRAPTGSFEAMVLKTTMERWGEHVSRVSDVVPHLWANEGDD